MTDFVLEQEKSSGRLSHILNYAKFLKQPLELWMFVPCDEQGNVLEEPAVEFFDSGNIEKDCNDYAQYFDNYKEAKERVLFEDCIYHDDIVRNAFCKIRIYAFEGMTIENLTIYKVKLTSTAIKWIERL